MSKVQFGYHDLLEPKIQTTPICSLYYLPPNFKELNYSKQEFLEPEGEAQPPTLIETKKPTPMKHNEHIKLEKPKPVTKKKSKTLGEKGKKKKTQFTFGKVGLWDSEEHALFMEGYEKYGRNWSQIAKEFCTFRTRQQVRSHAQKFFRKFDFE